ncbi:MAG: hypothetical protein IKE46_00245 [Selenomonadaceae bacterium]|nr:hypothetical protein [Selenomonadaceae bacterium]
MATREENLKKINDELEKLSDEQLEEVAGGTWHQTADDSHFLHTLNPDFNEINEAALAFTPGTVTENLIKEEWARYGVEFKWHGGAVYDNEYKVNGKDVSRDEAYAHARSVAWG